MLSSCGLCWVCVFHLELLGVRDVEGPGYIRGFPVTNYLKLTFQCL